MNNPDMLLGIMAEKWCLVDPESNRIVEIFPNEEQALIYQAHKSSDGLKIRPFVSAMKDGYQLSSEEEELESEGITDFFGEFAERIQSMPVDELPPPSEEGGLFGGASRVGSRMTNLKLTDLLTQATIQDYEKDDEIHDSLWKMEKVLHDVLSK